MINHKRYCSAFVAVIALIASLFVVTPAEAGATVAVSHSAGRTVTAPAPQELFIAQAGKSAPAGYRTLAIAYEHAWFGGASYELYVRDYGDCDAGGYTKEIISNDWKNRISSIRITPGSYCSMVGVYRKTWLNTNSGQFCYYGQLPMYDLKQASNCDNNVWGMLVYKGPRRG